jgi:tripartite-type tricarboxylate transporter receptor subunit TctC
MLKRILSLLLALLVASLAATAPAGAQTYPSRMIRIVVPVPVGAPPDIITRIVANELVQTEGWRIVVENKPGAIGTIGGAEVLRQEADGHTIISLGLPEAVAPALLANIGFRLDTDFTPVIKVMTASQVLVVNPAVPAASLQELVALLKSQPDKLTFSSGGFGTPAHLAGELFKQQTGVRAVHVPYQALPQAIGDLVNGTNSYQFITPLPILDLVASGKLRALAVTSSARIAALKDVPSVPEAGFPGLIVQDWMGFQVKGGTPEQVVARLNEAINKALAKQNVREAFAKIAAEPAGGSAAEFGAHIKAQVAYWDKVVKDAGIKIQQ